MYRIFRYGSLSMSILRAIRDKLASIDEVVPVLVFFEMIYLAVGQFIIWVILPVDKPYVALGFAIGVGFAVLSSIQNSMLLRGALSRGKRKTASAGMVIFMLIRIAAISAIIILAIRFKFCSAVAVLVGVLAIQAGVYFEPMVRKRREKKEKALKEAQNTEACTNVRDMSSELIEDSRHIEEDSGGNGPERETYHTYEKELQENLQENLQEDAQGSEGDRSR